MRAADPMRHKEKICIVGNELPTILILLLGAPNLSGWECRISIDSRYYYSNAFTSCLAHFNSARLLT